MSPCMFCDQPAWYRITVVSAGLPVEFLVCRSHAWETINAAAGVQSVLLTPHGKACVDHWNKTYNDKDTE